MEGLEVGRRGLKSERVVRTTDYTLKKSLVDVELFNGLCVTKSQRPTGTPTNTHKKSGSSAPPHPPGPVDVPTSSLR